MDKRIIKISWKEIGELIEKLAESVEGDFDGVYGIPRGGVVIATVLSHRLKIPFLEKPTKNSLIVDDISETGTTLKKYKGKKYACLHSSTWTDVVPDFFVAKKRDKNSWIEYPWEEK